MCLYPIASTHGSFLLVLSQHYLQTTSKETQRPHLVKTYQIKMGPPNPQIDTSRTHNSPLFNYTLFYENSISLSPIIFFVNLPLNIQLLFFLLHEIQNQSSSKETFQHVATFQGTQKRMNFLISHKYIGHYQIGPKFQSLWSLPFDEVLHFFALINAFKQALALCIVFNPKAIVPRENWPSSFLIFLYSEVV